MGKLTGPARDRELEARVVNLRRKITKKYPKGGMPFSDIGEELGFKRQRAFAIYSRYIKKVEKTNEAE